jgi:alkylhydroperoxidase family enzyme
LEELHKKYGDKVEFLAIYVREAHPVEGWRMSSNDRAGISIAQPVSLSQRVAVAGKCCSSLVMSMPLLVDEISDPVGQAYSGMPDRLYLIDQDGQIAYKGGRGPFGFKARELEQSLLMLLLDRELGGKKTAHGIPILSDGEAWKCLPAVEKGIGQPLPLWARSLAKSLPDTTAAMLELDYLQRVRSPLDPSLRAKMRWVAAHANGCAYSEADARADLRRAGMTDALIQAFEKGTANVPAAEQAALTFARKMTEAANTVTDAEMAQLMGSYGNQHVVAMVLLLAYANFQDRLILSLGLPAEAGGQLPPKEIRFVKKAAGAVQALAGTRPANEPSSSPGDLSSAAAWEPMDFGHLQLEMESQRARQPRILVPAWDDVRKNYPAKSQPAKAVRIKWTLVCMGYQPELASAWSACTRAFGREANQDRVFEESLFWIITRTLNCFY